jgi:hypothetical protein
VKVKASGGGVKSQFLPKDFDDFHRPQAWVSGLAPNGDSLPFGLKNVFLYEKFRYINCQVSCWRTSTCLRSARGPPAGPGRGLTGAGYAPVSFLRDAAEDFRAWWSRVIRVIRVIMVIRLRARRVSPLKTCVWEGISTWRTPQIRSLHLSHTHKLSFGRWLRLYRPEFSGLHPTWIPNGWSRVYDFVATLLAETTLICERQCCRGQ